ncbi:MAG: TonB-dependent receptor [Bacteroidota bacterium]
MKIFTANTLKYRFLPLLFAWIATAVFAGNTDKTTLSGKITDKETGELLAGVNIYVPDLKTGTSSDKNGQYKLDNLPSARILIQISLVGYKTIAEYIDLTTISARDFELESSVKEMNEIIITGTSQAAEKNKTPTPITLVTKLTLLQNASGNIIDALATQPGVSQITTGSGISKPVIRGLGYNRVVVVNDGIRQEGQQWGDEHGIEIDEFSVNSVEILKGPASLSYGSDAMAGVIHMISAPTLPEGTIGGNVLWNYQTNNGLLGYSGNFAGNKKGFIWNIRYSGKAAHDYKNKYDGYVFGTGFKESAISGITGINKSWGYLHLNFSSYRIMPEIAEGERDSASGKFIHPVALNDTVSTVIATENEMKSYSLFIPHQDIRHYKTGITGLFVIKNGYLKTTLGFQQNQRKEFGNVVQPEQYGLYFLLNTINYDVRYSFPEKNKWQTSAGINGMGQRSENKGTEFLVPEYSLFDIGGFITAKKSFEKADLSAGVRYDTRQINASALFTDSLGNAVEANDPLAGIKFSAFTSRYSNLSGSIGVAYRFSEKTFTKLNLSRGFRSPNIAELGANGEHEGAGRYEVGNTTMKAETSWQADYALGLNLEHISAEITLFGNSIQHYIHLAKLNSVSGGDSIIDPNEPLPVFQFTQGDAFLYGGEMMLEIHPHPLDWLHVESTFSLVNATKKNATDSTRYLPFIPAPKASLMLRSDFKKAGKKISNLYFSLSADHYFMQEKIFAAYGTETATPAYTLINLGAGADIVSSKKTLFSVYFSVNNLADIAWQNHLSRLKYTAENYLTGRTGIFNMGRNFSIKLLVPLQYSKQE